MQVLRKLAIALAVFVAVILGLWFYATHANKSDKSIAATEGRDITLVDPSNEKIPSVVIPDIIGWGPSEAPLAAPGMKVNRFAAGLDHPRTMLALPNGDILVAETDHPAEKKPGGIKDRIQNKLINEAGAGLGSPNTIVLLRDADGDGNAEQRFTLRREGLDSPSGMAWGDGKLYIANHDAVLAFDYAPGDTSLRGAPRKLMDLPPAGNHWMRNLLLSPDGKQLYIAVGSSSNIAENGIEKETGRAAIWQIDLARPEHPRQYAGGMRNPNGMDWNPSTGELWSTVVERDMLGPDLVPDYLTNVPIGAQYGWPWYYWRNKLDERVDQPMPIYLQEYIRKPEYALGAHTATLGMRFAAAGLKLGPDFINGAFVARHGSWNRNPISGYDVVFVKFDANGNPQGMPVPVLTGFIKDNGHVHGRPVWVSFDRTGGLLVTDDTSGIIWRVILPGAPPSPGVKPVAAPNLPRKNSINGANEAEFRRKFEEMMSRGQAQ